MSSKMENNMSLTPIRTELYWNNDIITKVMESVYSGETHYVAVPGKEELRNTLADFLKETEINNGNDVHVTAGIQEARFLTIHFMSSKNGTIYIPDVVHPGVKRTLDLGTADAEFLETKPDKRGLVTVEDIRTAAAAGAGVVYLESPSRLTGSCYDNSELSGIAEICIEHDLQIILDCGLYPWLEAPYASLGRIPGMEERCIVIGEAWPGAGLDEAFIGFIGASADFVQQLAVQKQVLSICTNAPSQNAALAAKDIYGAEHTAHCQNLAMKKMQLISVLEGRGARCIPCPLVNTVLCENTGGLQKELKSGGIRYIDSAYFGREGLIQIPVSEIELKKLT